MHDVGATLLLLYHELVFGQEVFTNSDEEDFARLRIAYVVKLCFGPILGFLVTEDITFLVNLCPLSFIIFVAGTIQL